METQLHCLRLANLNSGLWITDQRKALGSGRQGMIGSPQVNPRMEDVQGQHREDNH